MSVSIWIQRLVLACLCVGLSYGQGGSMPTAVERWQAMSEEERDVLRDRFERFRSLDPSAQEALRERHSSLRSAIDRHVASLSESERAQLETLPYRDRKRIARDLFHATCRFESGLGGRDGMAAMLDSLRNVEPELRPHVLKRTCLSLDQRLSAERLGELGVDLGLAPGEFERLGRDERRELVRERFGEVLSGRRGPWGGDRFGGSRGPEREGSHRADPSGRRGGDRATGERGVRDWGFGERGSPEAEGAERGPGSFGHGGFGRGGWGRPPEAVELPGLTSAFAEVLFESGRPKVSDFAELHLLSRDERHRAIDERVRARIQAAAADMPAELRERLAELDVRTLMTSLREGTGK